MLSAEEVKEILQETGAVQEGHFLLSSGLHSPVYVQCALVFQHPRQAERLGAAMAALFAGQTIDVVVSPAVGGIVTGQEVARALGARAVFAERQDGVIGLRRGFRIRPGERVLVADDVMTRGGSVRETLGAVRESDGRAAGIAVVVDRSGGDLDWEVELRSLLRMQAVTYPPEDCPLCRENLPLVKPGSRKQERP
jgi:orotate phosphoribosyltransferase